MKKLLSLLLLASLCLCLLPGCGMRDVPIVMEYSGLRLDEDVYEYWLCCYRAQFAYEETEGNLDRLAEIADINIRKTLVAAALFDSNGLQLDTAARDIINAAMDKLVENAGGTREELDKAAAAYGIDYDGLRLAITYEQKAQALYNYLYGTNGVLAPTDEQYETYYQATYARVKMVYISYVDFLTDEDGNRVWDPKNERYVYEAKTGTALSDQEKKAAAVRARLTSGLTEKDFDELIKTYDEDPATKGYPNGFYFSRELDYESYIPELTEKALSMKPGETGEVRSDYGVHILYALPCDKGAYAEKANADFFDGFTDRVGRYLYEETINSHLVEVTVYAEVKANTKYAEVEPNFDLYW
ncbi:MAG: hypothetical protein IJY20_01325 [Clostridia bacterium]|nr:hypothetical protein [Clostridia bacterium]